MSLRVRCGELICLLTCLFWAGTGFDSALAQENLQVGAARVIITPDYPVRLSGYGNRKTESEGVAQQIFTRAVVFGSEGQGSGPPAVLINIETCGFPRQLVDWIARELHDRHGIPRERIAVCATHSHSAPWLLDYAPNLLVPPLPDQDVAHCRQYEQELLTNVLLAVEKALQARQPARLFYASGRVEFARNRRVLQDGVWKGFGVTEGGPVDHRLPVLVAKNLKGEPVAIIANYACHCTTLGGDFNQISGDWAGYAQADIEQQFPGAIGMTIIGCGADANPEPRGKLDLCQQHGAKLAGEVQRLLGETLQPISGSLQCQFRDVELPLAPLPSEAEFLEKSQQKGQTGSHGQYFLGRLRAGEPIPTTVQEPVAVWTFGNDLAMVFLGGEVVVDYDLKLSETFDADRLWITAYANAVPCYIPSQRILREGGYEADFSMIYYRQPTRFSPEVEPALLGAVQGMVPEAFRVRPGKP